MFFGGAFLKEPFVENNKFVSDIDEVFQRHNHALLPNVAKWKHFQRNVAKPEPGKYTTEKLTDRQNAALKGCTRGYRLCDSKIWTELLRSIFNSTIKRSH